MTDATVELAVLSKWLTRDEGATIGKLFGKVCLKIDGKAFLAQQRNQLAFKLPSPQRDSALAVAGAELWDPSGKGRPMKEWVALPVMESARFPELALAALRYVAGAGPSWT